MTKEQRTKYLDLTEEEKNAFVKLYDFNSYLYLSETEIKKVFSDTDESKCIKEYLRKHKVKIQKSPTLIREIIYEALLTKRKDILLKNYLIYDSKRITVFTVDKLSTYLNVLSNILTNKSLHTDTQESFYRGQSSFGWELQPSIYRDDNWILNENKMIEEMIRQYPSFLNDKKRIDILTKLQHYGLPTRLLDLSENPIVGLFFACSDKDAKNEDGRILYFSPESDDIKYTNSDTVTILANISKMEESFGSSTIKNLRDRFVWFIQDEKPNFSELTDDTSINNWCYVKTHLNNERIKCQSGAFIITGTGKTKKEKLEIKDTLENNSILILVDRKRKQDLLNELKQLGIHEGSIYPEISKVTEYMKNSYMTKK